MLHLTAVIAALLLMVGASPQMADSRDTTVVTSALEAVAVREFTQAEQTGRQFARTVAIGARSVSVSETELTQLRVHGGQAHWPVGAAESVRAANRTSKQFGKLTLDGFASSTRNASAVVEVSLPGYVEHEAYVFVTIRILARHGYVVRLVQQNDRWQPLDVVPIGAA